jgi:tetratricopeptide (TPR) repeat protein
MHPVVRGYAADQLEARDKVETYDKIRDYFASLQPADLDEATEPADVKNSLEIYNAFVGAGRLDEAVDFYRTRFSNTLLFSLGPYTRILELLKPLFRNDFQALPLLKSVSAQSYALTVLGIALEKSGRGEDALPVYRKALGLDLNLEDWESLATDLMNYASALHRLNRYSEKAAAASFACDLSEAAGDEDGATASIYDQMINAIIQGRFVNAEALEKVFRERPQPPRVLYRDGAAEYWRCYNRFQQGQFTEAEWQAGYELAARSRNVSGQYQFLALRAEWALSEDRPEPALEAIEQALQITRRVGTPSPDYHDLRAWALARLGREDEARASLEEGDQKLYAAETYLVLGDRAAARECVLKAYRRAWGEGPPYIRWYELERCRKLLAELGEPEPQLPPFDPAKVPPIPYEKEIRAVIERLKADKQGG